MSAITSASAKAAAAKAAQEKAAAERAAKVKAAKVKAAKVKAAKVKAAQVKAAKVKAAKAARAKAARAAADCTPGYSPCLPYASDYDCSGGSGNGPEYVYGSVRVSGYDPYDLDRDGDGVGCD